MIIIIKLQLKDLNKEVKYEICGNEIEALYEGEYMEGDFFVITSEDSEFLFVKLDATMKEALLYLPEKYFEYAIPAEDIRKSGYHEDAFSGKTHTISVREATDEEIKEERIVSLNPYAKHNERRFFPNAYANFVTRESPCFFERNAIDGVCENKSHGGYPYHSWAGGAREDLEYYLDFGNEIETEKIVVFLRADFPHDTYWKSFDIEFSDKSIVHCEFEGTDAGQTITFPKTKTTSIHLTNFKQVTTPLSWAALSQIEVYGNYIKKENKGMEVRQASNSQDVKHYTTERLREEFHIANLFTKDNIRMVYSHIDRIITAGFMPVFCELKLEAGKELAADYFLQRREMGCINIGGEGIITVDGVEYHMNPRDGIYIGMGNKEITFKCVDPENPPKFYVSSCPAHTSYPIVKIDITKAKKVPCGSFEECNKRVINQYIHPEVMKSCQLSMGLTQLEPGSNWNTMPCHTHDRRMEVYLYLDMNENDVVFHMMGEPTQTRHIIMHNEEAVISPSWSIHSGVGTKAYSFIWAMCGENQEFTDMDHIETKNLR